MERKLMRAFGAAVVLCASGSVALGDVFSADDSVYGEDALTVDTAQNLAFLDLEHSIGYSVLEMFNLMGADGPFEGFRYASAFEVLALISNIGSETPPVGGILYFKDENNFVDDVLDFVGPTYEVEGALRDARGVTGTHLGAGNYVGVQVQDTVTQGNDAIVADYIYTLTETSNFRGHWIVREIPAPGGFGVFALMGVCAARRRR